MSRSVDMLSDDLYAEAKAFFIDKEAEEFSHRLCSCPVLERLTDLIEELIRDSNRVDPLYCLKDRLQGCESLIRARIDALDSLGIDEQLEEAKEPVVYMTSKSG